MFVKEDIFDTQIYEDMVKASVSCAIAYHIFRLQFVLYRTLYYRENSNIIDWFHFPGMMNDDLVS